jgi:glutathione synthase/RimK-type ligase-like ATP-grasp enzyme
MQRDLVKPDLIYRRGKLFYNDGFLRVVNGDELDRLSVNKWSQYCLLSDLQAKSFLALNSGEIVKNMSKLSGQMMVIKPLNLTGGQGVEIIDKDSFAKYDIFPAIVQEFQDSSRGYGDLARGVHDMRVMVVDGEAVAMAIREPAPGSLLSNTHQGGGIEFYSREQIPRELFAKIKVIDQRLEKYGARFYSADFLFNGCEWILLEINGRPGIPAMFQDGGRGGVAGLYEVLAQWFSRCAST